MSAELVHALTEGPGVVVLENAFPDHDVVDRVAAAFDAMIAEERAAGSPAGDHFAAPGAPTVASGTPWRSWRSATGCICRLLRQRRPRH